MPNSLRKHSFLIESVEERSNAQIVGSEGGGRLGDPIR